MPDWKPYPQVKPPKPGKYIVLLECEGKQWTSIKLWGRGQYHSEDFVGHEYIGDYWNLCQEFSSTKVVAWCSIPQFDL